MPHRRVQFTLGWVCPEMFKPGYLRAAPLVRQPLWRWLQEGDEKERVIVEVLEKSRQRTNPGSGGRGLGISVAPWAAGACAGHHYHVGGAGIIVLADFHEVAVG